MGKTYTSVPFVLDTFSIYPHTATRAEHIDRDITVREFANGCRVSIEHCAETDEYLIRNERTSDFILGPASKREV